jgi:hypothetical protein
MVSARQSSARSLRVCSIARGVFLFGTLLLPKAAKIEVLLNSIRKFAIHRHKNILEIGEHNSHINV